MLHPIPLLVRFRDIETARGTDGRKRRTRVYTHAHQYTEAGLFGGFELRHEGSDTRVPQPAQLILKPVSAPWPCRNCKASRPWSDDPKQLRAHSHALLSPSGAHPRSYHDPILCKCDGACLNGG